MKKKLSILLAFVMVCTCLLTLLTACDNAEEKALQLYLLKQDNQTVSEEFILPLKIGEFDANWTSDKENVVIEKRTEDFIAKVVRPESGFVDVTLTVTVGRSSKNFTVRVVAYDVYDIADSFYFKNESQTVYPGEFELASETTYEGKIATIAWEVENSYANVMKIENGKCVVTAPADGTAVDVRIVAKFTYANETATKYYKFKVSANKSLKDLYLDEVIDAPVAGTAYKLAMYQGTAEKVLYANGEMDGKYLATTEKVAEAADAMLEATTDGFFLKVGSKYITLTGSYDGKNVKAALSLADTATTVFTVDETNHILLAKVTATDENGATKEGTFFLGTYGTYTTISASSTYYIEGDKITALDNTQFALRLVSDKEIKVEGGNPTPGPGPDDPTPDALKEAFLNDIVASPAADTAYKFAMYQATSKKVLYATGEMNGYYLATTEDVEQAAEAKLEATEGGYFLKLGDNYVKLTGRLKDGTKLSSSLALEATATTVFKIGENKELYTKISVTTDAGENLEDDYYLGTFGENTTIGASAIKYISGDNASKIDDTQFVARLVKGEALGGGETPDALKEAFLNDIVASPAADTAYKFAMYQATSKKVLYATGEMNGYYLATTEDVVQAAEAKLEATEGGYFLKLGDKYVKLTGRLKDGTKLSSSLALEATATTVFKIGENKELYTKISVTTDAGENLEDDYYLGTFGENTTIGASAIKYISGDNASKIDDTQFVARLVKGEALGGGEPTPGPGPDVPDTQGTTIETALTVAEAWTKFGSLGNQAYSENPMYVKGIVVTAPTFNEKYNSYGCYIADSTAEGAKRVQVYSCKLADGVAVPNENDLVILYGYFEMYNSSLEITFKGDVDGQFVALTAGTSTVAFEQNDNAEITLSKTSGLNGETFTFTVAAKNGATIMSVRVNGKEVTAVDGTYTATINGNTVVAVDAMIVTAGEKTATVDLKTNFATYAKDWGTGYTSHTLTSSDLSVDTMSLSVVFSNANKQSVGSAIDNMPVLASKSSAAQYVTISVTGMSIKSATFNLEQWTTKKFTTLTIEYTTDGTNWTAVEGVGFVNGSATTVSPDYTTLTASILPANVSAVRLVVLGSTTSNNQVGIAGFTVVAE